MFKKEYLSLYLKYGFIAAILFSIPMIFFVHSGDYRNSWLLFLGNVFFLVAIAVFMLSFNRKKNEDASTQTMAAAGHIATFIGIITACILGVIALAVFSPALSDKVMEDAPASTGTGQTHGMIFFIFMNSVIGNLAGGSFVSIILPYSAKRNQTKDKKSEVLNN